MGDYELVVLRDADPRALRAMLDNTPAAIFLKDPDGRYLLVNRAFERLHGKPASELVGQLDREVLPPDIAERMRVDDLRVMSERAADRAAGGGPPRRADADLPVGQVPADRRATTASSTASAASRPTSRTTSRLEARLREAQRLEAVGQLAGGVAHDFNNLLAVIANYAAFVRKELADGSRAAGDVDQIITASRRASELTRRLLLFSRRQSGTPEVLSLRRVIESVELLLQRTLGDEIDLQVHCDDRLWDVEADRSQLEQVLMSLALNSREAMPDGGDAAHRGRERGHARSRRARRSRAVRLTVTDTGRGMAREVTAHAFEPFFTTKAVSGHGVGLGLATVYGIVTNARGRIELESEPGEGTTVTVLLPAVRRASDDEPSPSAPRGRGETVLVVEDADAVRVLTGRHPLRRRLPGRLGRERRGRARAPRRRRRARHRRRDAGHVRRRARRHRARAPPRPAGRLRLRLHRRHDDRRVRRPGDRVPGEAVRRRRPAPRRPSPTLDAAQASDRESPPGIRRRRAHRSDLAYS